MTTEREWRDETPPLPDHGHPALAGDGVALFAAIAIVLGLIMTACERM
jgi:hypothetical protein